MSQKRLVVVLIGLVILVAACSETRPTALFLPTSPPEPTSAPPATSTAVVEPTSAATLEIVPTAAQLTPTSPSQPAPTSPPQPTPTSPPQPTPTSPPQPSSSSFPPVIGLEPWLSGFSNPVYVTYVSDAPEWESRMVVVEKAGRILLIENGQVRPESFLDITDRVGSSSSEQGLLSVAFPRDFDATGLFYLNYTDARGDTVVARYELAEGDGAQGDPGSEQKLLQIPQPAANHNGGQLQFGPDGYLYIGTGDGGSAGDPWGNAQHPAELLGKMLRIDVGGAGDYRIPSDNPFVGWPGVHSEIWALGLRNPWRFSFDRATGDLYIADVGQNLYEEVNFKPARSGGGENYGWDIMEGTHCFEPPNDCDRTGLTLPVAEYDHSQGCSVTGGYVYRGANYPKLRGVYLFGDFCSGNIWGLRQASASEWEMALLLDSELAISSFGQDVAGELYIVDYRDGAIHRLIALP